MKLDVYNKAGEKLTEQVEVSDTIFGIKPNEHCVYLTVKSEMAALRQGTHSSKTRGEVKGSNRKPWRQKGTGRSRVGSLRNPSRVHGGAAFGPKPKKYNVKVNRKVKLLARKSVLSDKISAKQLLVVKEISIDKPKTKEFVSILHNFKITDKKITVLLSNLTDDLYLSSRNIKNVVLLPAESASTYDLLDCQMLMIDVAGIEKLNTQLAN